ncbi:hypothetical protein [Priestia endophytica]|uniref:Uncharacterized protein n=1 Tax=Priestia endophytica TaxID=135735 RepID=A0AAX1Q2F4_9BACI|nr:hypothetical protein [Priestia endophytica]MCM3536815.1 hypothetical protein [Priestia endophytica]RAS72161.1 hypothetical protein A3864_24105 [Priestia endophytica]RAS89797.1 hypothetical protein A3863_11340 [Priestia endophytica]
MEERVKLIRIRELAYEILHCRLQDQTAYCQQDLQEVVELLARVVVDLTNTQLREDADPPTSLKATVSKTRMAYNTMMVKQRDVKVQ